MSDSSDYYREQLDSAIDHAERVEEALAVARGERDEAREEAAALRVELERLRGEYDRLWLSQHREFTRVVD